jgi:raffinose/stachyose/melibiose transport system permease protein
MGKRILAWALCLPAIMIFSIFYVGPAVMGLLVSLFTWDGSAALPVYAGLSNYTRLVSDPRFWNSVRVNLFVLSGNLLFLLPTSFFVALLLRKKGFAIKLFRNVFFFPQLLSVATIALVWMLLLDPYQGFINQIILGLGGSGRIAWLGDPRLAIVCVVIVVAWSQIGFHIVLMLAGLSGIPDEYYDAVSLETDSPLIRHLYITIPMLRETLFVSFTVIIGNAFGHATGLVFLLTRGGPMNATELMGLYSYSMAFQGHQFGYSSTISFFILVLVVLLVFFPARKIAMEKLQY